MQSYEKCSKFTLESELKAATITKKQTAQPPRGGAL